MKYTSKNIVDEFSVLFHCKSAPLIYKNIILYIILKFLYGIQIRIFEIIMCVIIN